VEDAALHGHPEDSWFTTSPRRFTLRTESVPVRTPETTADTFPWVGLIVLSLLVFTTVTSEFLPTGLLPEMAADLGVTQSQIGLLITLFAASVVLTAAPLTLLTHRFSRKSLVITVMLVFVLGNVLAAVAPNFAVLAVARVIGGCAHGLFWAVVGAYSTHLVPKHRIGRAVAITSGGGTAAFVLGVPLGTALGQAVGWRVAFGVIAAAIVLLIVLVLRFLPPVEHGERLATGEIALPLRKDPTIPTILLLCVIAIVAITGQNLLATYVAPVLRGPMGFEASAVAGMLFLYGGAGVIGIVAAGLGGDRWPRAGLIVSLALVVMAQVVLGVAPENRWIAIPAFVVWGAAFGAVPAMLNARMMRTASLRMRDIASAYVSTSFNLGIGLGALIGAIALDRLGAGVLPFGAALLVALGVVVAVLGDLWLTRRSALRAQPA